MLNRCAMNFNNFEFHPSKLPADVHERQSFLEKKKQEFMKDLRENPRYKAFYDKYDPVSVDSFIVRYAAHKIRLIGSMDYYLELKDETKELRYRDRTEAIFWLIAQKKLFNMQCLWRAEKIEIPEVKITPHFDYWGNHIKECPFLDPVSSQEVEVMKQFLISNNYSDATQSWLCGWQDYNEITEQDENDDYDYMPEWYDFYDGRMGTGYLYKLPDIRGDKEDFYRSLVGKKNREEREKNPPPPQPAYVPPPPRLFGNNDQINEFVSLYEDDYIKELQKGSSKQYKQIEEKHTYEMDEIEEAIDLLSEAEYPVYMPGGLEWKEAIIKCGQQYINTIVASELDAVYEEYLMLHELGIRKNFTELEEEYRKDGLCKMIEDYMLEGRVLNGEPRDLNF